MSELIATMIVIGLMIGIGLTFDTPNNYDKSR